MFKGTVNEISSDPPCKVDNILFPEVTPCNLYSVENTVIFLGLKVFNSDYFLQ